MKVLFAASECAPFIKTGGLADVVAALPKALARLGVTVRVILPLYPALRETAASGAEVARIQSPFGELSVVAVSAGGLELLLLDARNLYDRPGNPYASPAGDWDDNHRRFGALSFAAAAIAREGLGGWLPDILHAHDWQAGLAPAYLRLGDWPSKAKVVTTIHNVAFQGTFPAWTMHDLDLPLEEFTIDGYEYHGGISFLKAALVWSDAITTVSPTYARELTQPAFGMGLEGLLATRRAALVGILNGVEVEVWDPATDPALAAHYTAGTLTARAENRAALMLRLGLDLPPDAPLFIVVSRLTWQKGIDLIVETLPRLLARGAGLAVLGSGEAGLEAALRAAMAANPGRIAYQAGYDEPLSHLMQAGGDAILLPSRFEPCGLTQLYGLRYGCLPVVARTGGLADTVIDANEAAIVAGVATGYVFSPVTADALADAIDRAVDGFADRALWHAMMRTAMTHPVGWDRSAATYLALYEELLPRSEPGAMPKGHISVATRHEPELEADRNVPDG